MFRRSGTTDQDVIYVDSHPSKVTGQLVHDLLKIARSRANAKWKSHLKQYPSVGAESQMLLTFGSQHYLVIGISQVNLCKTIPTFPTSDEIFRKRHGMTMWFQLMVNCLQTQSLAGLPGIAALRMGTTGVP